LLPLILISFCGSLSGCRKPEPVIRPVPGTFQIFTFKKGENLNMPYDGVGLTKAAYDEITRIKTEDLRKLRERRLRELRGAVTPAPSPPTTPPTPPQ
ncbi:hypothetical protein LCGC14_1854410, partial [marine sediment metagenome]